MRFQILPGLLLFAAFQGAQIQPHSGIHSAIPPIKLLLQCPKQSGRYQMPRGEPVSASGGPFGTMQTERKLHLFRGASVANANGQSQQGTEVSLPSNLVQYQASYAVELTIPSSVPNGDYLLQIEVVGKGLSGKVPIKLVDAPPHVLKFYPPTKVGGPFSFVVRNVPSNAKVVVARTESPYPVDWWSAVAATQSTAILTPQSSPSGSAATSLSATMPAGMGTGSFKAWVQGGTPVLGSTPEFFAIVGSNTAAPVYTMRYDGIDSLIDTDELGDDEMYAIFSFGLSVMGRQKPTDPWTDVHETYFGHQNGPVHTGLQKGQSRGSTLQIFKLGDTAPVIALGFAVSLFEQDDPTNEAAFGNQLMGKLQNHKQMKPNQVKDLAAGVINDFRNSVDFIADEYLGTKGVPMDDLVKLCRKQEGWHVTSVVISGDGGKFRLRFSLRADPKVGAYK